MFCLLFSAIHASPCRFLFVVFVVHFSPLPLGGFASNITGITCPGIAPSFGLKHKRNLENYSSSPLEILITMLNILRFDYYVRRQNLFNVLARFQNDLNRIFDAEPVA